MFDFDKGTIYFDVALKNPKIILNGYDFLIYRKLSHKTVWICCQYYCSTIKHSRCKSKITTIGREAFLDGEHNHAPKHIKTAGMMSQTVTIKNAHRYFNKL